MLCFLKTYNFLNNHYRTYPPFIYLIITLLVLPKKKKEYKITSSQLWHST